LAKFTAFLITHSNAILTDALESIVNVVASFIGLYSLFLSAKPRDADHPYGHGKIEFISASIEGSMVSFSGLTIVVKSIYNFFHPHPILNLDSGIAIVMATGVINYAIGYICVRQGRKTDSLALTGSGEHLKSDAYSTFGIVVALALIIITGYGLLDNIVAIAMGSFICYTGYKVLRKAVAGIMDEADYDLLKRIILKLNDHRQEEWVDIHNMRVIKYGSVLHIDCHFTVPWYFKVKEAHHEVDELDQLVRSEMENPVELFIHTDACVPPGQCSICLLQSCTVREAKFEKRIEWNLESTLQNRKHSLENLPEDKISTKEQST
jgi:cation diffusion facilitator family transporter